MNIYDYHDSRSFLLDLVAANRATRGYKSRLAKHAGCHRTVLSQILAGTFVIGLDHAANVAAFAGLSDDETQYFLDLVMLERTASKRLKRLLEDRIAARRRESRELETKLKDTRVADEVVLAMYYSNWIFPTLHTALAIAALGQVSELAERFKLPPETVAAHLSQLETWGLAERSAAGWKSTTRHLHLSKKSPLTANYHVLMRQRACEAIHRRDSEAIHYTSIHTLSRADFEQLRQLAIAFLQTTRDIGASSVDEEVYQLSLDFHSC